VNHHHPAPADDLCSDCGTAIEPLHGETRCPTCFDRYLFDIDVGFLDSYRRFGCRSPLIVAETLLRGLVVESPEHRKVLAMTIFEQYVHAMNDLAGLFAAFRHRHEAPILKSFLEFRLEARSAAAFFDAVRTASDVELLAGLELPLPGEVPALCPHLDNKDAYAASVAIYQLVQDLRKATDKGNGAALALAQFASSAGGSIVAEDAKWLNGAASGLTPDQVALLILDTRRRAIHVQGLTADESAMGQVVDAIDTATRAASNLIFAYLQTKDL
jgi:hypothetical protein